mmetsp:Transcript_44750/g.57319  ORF Transcript_44750/g.57319 Transcript_44750/m.57319 type:complete len:157 (+) Transcript_44750:93-563(+)
MLSYFSSIIFGEEEPTDPTSDSDDDLNTEDPEYQVLKTFKQVLRNGIDFRQHGITKPSVTIHLTFHKGVLYWSGGRPITNQLREIVIKDLKFIEVGKSTNGFSDHGTALGVDPALCFSLITSMGDSLDLETSSNQERDACVQGFSMLIAASQNGAE